jgi:hypothetical protein
MPHAIAEISPTELLDPDSFLRAVAEPARPVVIRRLIDAWPAVQSASRSPTEFQRYVSRFDCGKPVETFVGDPRIAGKYYYDEDLKGFNFERKQMRFGEALSAIIATSAAQPRERSMYVGSVPLDDCLPGFRQENSLRIVKSAVVPRIWFGHASNVSSHYDTFDNVACVVAGRRRFTLFAPKYIDRLYVGPLDHTMAGQPVSLAASASPDDERFPLFREIQDQALAAELDPGDAIYIPKLWWHQVEATSAFNVLVNYWWDAFSVGPDAPSTALLLSMITIAERPAAEREAWKAFFEHYVFRTKAHPLAHLPASAHGILGPLQPTNYSRIRARIMQLLRGV